MRARRVWCVTVTLTQLLWRIYRLASFVSGCVSWRVAFVVANAFGGGYSVVASFIDSDSVVRFVSPNNCWLLPASLTCISFGVATEPSVLISRVALSGCGVVS